MTVKICWHYAHLVNILMKSLSAAKNQKITDDYYLTIIPRARMGSESIAHEAEGRMGY